MRCAVYTRVSKAEDGDSSSTDRQERNCLRLVEMRGWEAVEVFTDIDRSAYKAGTYRPSLERMLRSVEDGEVDAVVVWKLDRLTRRSQDFERIWAICEGCGVALVSATEPVDTSSPIGVAVVRMLITFAGLESTVRSQRLAAKHLEDAQAGIPRSGHRPFGFTREMTIIPAEAELIREAAERVIQGDTPQVIARDWNDRGITGTRGGPWSTGSLRQVVLAPRLVGDRAHKGEVAATDCWEPILDRSTANGVREALAGGRDVRKRRPDHPSLLGGLVECDNCGILLVQVSSNGERRYRCQPRRGGCGRNSILAEVLEDFVVHYVRWRLTQRPDQIPRSVARAVDRQAVTRMLRSRESSLERLNAAYFVDGALSQPEWRRLRAEIVEMSELDIRRTEPDRRPAALPSSLSYEGVSKQWKTLSNAAKKAAVELELHRAVLSVGPRQEPRFDPSRIRLSWTREVEGAPPLYPSPKPRHLWAWGENHQPRVPPWIPSSAELRERGGPFTAPEACRIAEVIPKRLQRAVRNGHVPASGRGDKMRFDLDDLDEWIEAGMPQLSSPSTGG